MNDQALMSLESRFHPSRGQIPEFDFRRIGDFSPLAAAGGQHLAIRRIGSRPDPVFMALEKSTLLAGGPIVDANTLILARQGKVLAVGGKS